MRTTIIIILVTLAILLGGVWVYLLLNGAPESMTEIREDIFGAPAMQPITTVTPQVPVDPVLDAGTRSVAIGARLAQLTDRAVAGAVVAQIASSTVIRYVEKGTGHIYEISLATGLEERISNTTIPRIVEAVWSPRGDTLVLVSDVEGVRGETILANLSTTPGGAVTLAIENIETLRNPRFGASGTFFFTTINERGGTSAWARSTETGNTQKLFEVPFAEARVLWDVWDEREHYVFSRPALGFLGYLYRAEADRLIKIDEGYALSAARPLKDVLLVNKASDAGPYTLAIDILKGTSDFLRIQTLEEKCAGGTSVWCATSDAAYSTSFPISWYQGLVSYRDAFWEVREDGTDAPLFDPESIAREPLDVTSLMYGDGHLIFKNKIDDSLWIFNP